MKVALDGTPLTISSDGTARYTAELSQALAVEFPADEFLLLSDQPFPAPTSAPANLRSITSPASALNRRWWSCGLPSALARHQVSVFHGTAFSVPYLAIRPAVLTLHDFSPWLDPAWHSHADRTRKRTPYLVGLGLATVLLTVTEAIRREAIDYFSVPSSRVFAVPSAASAIFRPVAQAPAAVPYFLYAGTLEPRKNVPFVIDAWREVAKLHAVELILVGRRRPDFPALRPEPGLRIAGEVSDVALAGLYSGAAAFLYPSFYEGFGLPVLEAMQSGAAVIASRDPAIMEVAGDGALLLDARDRRGWVEAMTAVLGCFERRQQLRERGLGRAQQFSWSRTARLTYEVYGEAIRRFGA
jgi:glycosyltransferase involved in cell wall biosynthesis